jgi:WD40 repeat protein
VIVTCYSPSAEIDLGFRSRIGHRKTDQQDDDKIWLWDVPTPQADRAPLTGHMDVVESVAFSPGGRPVFCVRRLMRIPGLRVWPGALGDGLAHRERQPVGGEPLVMHL